MSELRGRRSGDDPSDEHSPADLGEPDSRAAQPSRPADGDMHSPAANRDAARSSDEPKTEDRRLTAQEKLERHLDTLYWPGYSNWSATDQDDSVDQQATTDAPAIKPSEPAARQHDSQASSDPRTVDKPASPEPEPRERSEKDDPFVAFSPEQRERLLRDDTVARLQYLNDPDDASESQERPAATPDPDTSPDRGARPPVDANPTDDSEEQAAQSADNPMSGPADPSGTETSAGADHEFVDHSSPAEMDQYRRIRKADDLDALADSSGLPYEVIHEAKQHLFMREHDVALGPGDIRHGYFRPDAIYGDLWERVSSGSELTAENRAQFWSLVAHEYVESKLMEAGLPYLSAEPGAWGEGNRAEFLAAYPSAHNTAPLSTQSQVKDLLRHWTTLGLPRDNLRVAPDLSNLDDVVRVAKEGLGL
ncbi:hypothetical protein ACQHIV_23370 [Kribbella sp. GL6]|uniref:hypothetical protein n=1 Tax=Kribbella sp. GL6 TaxID=3419765 RepID=UPI003CFC050D